MRKGRYLAMCALCLIAGNCAGSFITLAPEFYLLAALIFAFVSLFFRNSFTFSMALLFAGAASVQIGRMPTNEGMSAVKIFATEARNRFSSYLETVFPQGDELAIIKALAIGDKSDVSSDIMREYKASGAVHLLALSGLHVGVIYKIISSFLKPAGGHIISRYARTLFVLVSMWSFAILSGLSASISRAVIMITFYEMSYYFHSDRDGLTILSASALFIVLTKPESPREIGFQLSFLAMLSIYLIYPRLKTILATENKLLQYVWNTLCISISCQITTGVVAYLYFGTFPVYFMITNLLAMPLITIVMHSLAISLITVKIPFAGQLFASILQFSVSIMNKIMSIIGGL